MDNLVYKPKYAKYILRIAAFVLDFILFLVLLTGILFILMKIVNFDYYYNILDDEYKRIGYKIYDEATKSYHYISESAPNFNEVIEKYKNSEIIKEYGYKVNNLVLNIPIISIFISMLILEFIVPLIFKNGQTIGMKCFHIALISKSNIKIKPIQLFTRFLFGKTVLMAIIPYMCLFYSIFNMGGGLFGTIIIALIYIINIVLLFKGNHASLSDIIASVYPVDSQQTIFYDNEEELQKALNHEKELDNKVKKVY